jgi:hypothetical protein
MKGAGGLNAGVHGRDDYWLLFRRGVGGLRAVAVER